MGPSWSLVGEKLKKSFQRPVLWEPRFVWRTSFFNTPARLKYMKSQQAELSHIIDIVNRLGLAHPEISFSLISDGKEMTRTAGTGQLRQAIAGIYGLASAKKMIAIENSDLRL